MYRKLIAFIAGESHQRRVLGRILCFVLFLYFCKCCLAQNSCGTVYDADGNKYETVQIGKQCWMKENMKTEKDKDGNILRGSKQPENIVITGQKYYDLWVNDGKWRTNYGEWKNAPRNDKQYDWSTASKICPNGWHLPTEEEFSELRAFSQSHSSGESAARSLAAQTGWTYKEETDIGYEMNKNNKLQFTAYPYGYYEDEYKRSAYISSVACFWTATSLDSKARTFGITMDNGLKFMEGDKSLKMSVRCIRDKIEEPSISSETVSDIDVTSVKIHFQISYSGVHQITSSGICWGKDKEPTIEGRHKELIGGTGNFNTEITSLESNCKYYCRVYAINDDGIFYGKEFEFQTPFKCGISPMLEPYSGKSYATIELGTQCWMRQDLTTSYRRNGTEIKTFYGSEWAENTPCHNGIYYNYSALFVKICPDGWHIPDKNDFKELNEYIKTTGDGFDKLTYGGVFMKSTTAYGVRYEVTFSGNCYYWSSDGMFRFTGKKFRRPVIIWPPSFWIEGGAPVRCVRNQ